MKTIRLKRHANIIPDDIFTYLGCEIITNGMTSENGPSKGFVKSIRICDYKNNKKYKYMVYITFRLDEKNYPNLYRGFKEGYLTDFMFFFKNNEKYLNILTVAEEDYLVMTTHDWVI